MNDVYIAFVEQLANCLRQPPVPTPAAVPAHAPPTLHANNQPLALLVAPHPDDESLIGGLALRLLAQGWQIGVVAASLGSNPAHWQRRSQELSHACAVLGFGQVPLSPDYFGSIHLATRTDTAGWSVKVARMAAIIAQWQPKLLIFPHANDGHPAHMGSHFLVMDALQTLPSTRLWLAETETYINHPAPNCLIELTSSHVAQLMAATAQHSGEVSRNPYHWRLPFRLIAEATHGIELMQGTGTTPPAGLLFAQRLALSFWDDRSATKKPLGFCPAADALPIVAID